MTDTWDSFIQGSTTPPDPRHPAIATCLAHELHLISRPVVFVALQPIGVAGVAGKVVPRGGVELVAEEIVPRE